MRKIKLLEFHNGQVNLPYYVNLFNWLKTQSSSKVFPEINQINNWLNLVSDSVKVVWVGQDPYHKPGVAHGLAFSTTQRTVPASLRNIFKELKRTHGISRSSADLSGWAKQGVLLVNVIQTVEQSKPNSHQNQGWETYFKNLISFVNAQNEKIVFILLGKKAQDFGKYITNPVHKIIAAPHPSPLAAKHGFIGSDLFLKIDQELEKSAEIDWSK